MKHKVNKKVLRRTFSLILVMIMLVTGLSLDMKVESAYAAQKAEKTEDNGKIKDYIIVAKNEKAYNRALNAIGEESIKNGEKFIYNNIIVAELSEQEAEELNEDSNIIIEADLKVKARINLVDDKEDNLLFFEDYSGHGTSVAGIIAGSNGENNVEGINPNVEL